MKLGRSVFAAASVVALVLTTSSVFAQDEAPMDHAAIASSYQSEAKEAQAKAASHELMLNRYKNMPMVPKGSAVPKEAMVKHCQKLVDSYKSTATQATDLAKLHQEAATASK